MDEINPIGTSGWDEKVLKQGDKTAIKRSLAFLESRKENDDPFALFFSTIDPHRIYGFQGHRKNKKKLGEIPLPNSWNHPNYDQKPNVQLQFLTDDQGRALHEKDKIEWQRYRSRYKERINIFDKMVGSIIKQLKKIGKYDDTIIIITSDHGDMDTHNRLLFKGPFMYDHLMRIPLMIRIPEKYGGIQPKEIDDILTSNVDLVPTILDLIEDTSNYKQTCDGISLKPVLTKDPNQDEMDKLQKRDHIFGQYYSKQKWVNPIRTIRTMQYKYNFYIHNIIKKPKYATVLSEMKLRMDEMLRKLEDPFYNFKRTDRMGNILN